MQGRTSRRAVVRTPQSLAVHGHYPLNAFGKLCHEPHKPLPESFRIRFAQHPGEGIVAGNAVFRLRKGPRKLPFGRAEQFRVGASPAAANDGAQGDDQDVVSGCRVGNGGGR